MNTAAKGETTSAPPVVLLETRVRGAASKNTTGVGPGCSVSSTLRWGSWQVYDGTAVGRLDSLDYFGARYFSGAQGRFTSPDVPLLDQDPSDPQSWNLYGYVRNNPLIFTDPTGNGCVYVNSSGTDVGSVNNEINSSQCGETHGYWVDGTVTQARFAHGSLILTGTTNGSDTTSASYGLGPDPGLLALQRGTQLAEPGVNLAAGGTAVVMGGAFGSMLYGAIAGGQATGALGVTLLTSQARHIEAIENAIANHVTLRDLSGAAKETAGYVIKTGNKVWDHRQELIETARNLRGSVRALRNSLNDPGHGAVAREVVQQAIQKAETALRQIDAALRR